MSEYTDFIELYRDDRVAFATNVLRLDLVDWQREELEALDRGCLRISIRSGHGVGKTAFLATAILHFLLFKFPCKVVCTAPSAPQLFDALASEAKKWVGELPAFLKDEIEVSADRIYLRRSPESAYISFRTARAEVPEALQGIHQDNVLLVVDEASGVPESIFEAGSGSMSTAGAITLLTSNPTRRSGFFYKTQTEWADKWRVRKISCFDSPLVDVNFITEMRERYGVDSPVYFIRVLGEFPSAEEDTFIPYHLVESAIGRDIAVSDTAPVYWGLDVARFGNDKSALAKRQGGVLLEPIKTWKQLDLMELCGRVKHEFDTLAPSEQPSHIFVDTIGLGAGVADRLRELSLPVVDVNVSESPSMGETYMRLRDEIWGNMRAWFNSRKVSLPKTGCENLRSELTTIKMVYSSAGKLQAESKEMMRKRGLDSPNEADALGLTFALEGGIASGATNSRYRNKSINEGMDTNWFRRVA